MNLSSRLQKVLQKLPPKQQALDFGDADPWKQLPAADRQACRDAIAALVAQVATTSDQDNHPLKKVEEHE